MTFEEFYSKQSFQILSSKRGNSTYAKKKRKLAWQINQGMKGMEWDYECNNSRNIVRDTHLILITLTFDRKLTSKEKAWHLLTAEGKELNKLQANISKIFGKNATWKIKEGTVSGYPAPHILVMLDRPIRAFRYRGTWRIQSNSKVERLKEKWKFGFLDVRAIVSNKIKNSNVIGYLTKYLTKFVSFKYEPGKKVKVDDLGKEATAILTNVWNKVYRSRDVLSKSFKQRLNAIHDVRLDRIYPELKLPNKDSIMKKWILNEINYDQLPKCSLRLIVRLLKFDFPYYLYLS